MAHLAQVSRDWFYNSDRSTPTHHTQLKDQAMTWQQEEQFRNAGRKNRRKNTKNGKWKRLDLSNLPASPPLGVTADDCWSNQKQYNSPVVRKETENSKKTPPTPSSPHLTHQLLDIKPSSPPLTNISNSIQKTRQQAPFGQLQPMILTPASTIDQSKAMRVTQSAYIPPHLRKRLSAEARVAADHESKPGVSPGGAFDKSPSNSKDEVSTHTQSPSNGVPHRASPSEWHKVDPKFETQQPEAWAFDNPNELQEPNPGPSATTYRTMGSHWREHGPIRKKTVWIKNKDLKPLPSDDVSDGGVAWSNSNGDPDYDVKKLVDWNGDWMPPPEHWIGRKAFNDRHFGQNIEKWIDSQHRSCVHIMDITRPEYKEGVTEELAPRTWIPATIEGDAPQQFWALLQCRAPAPLSDAGIQATGPWWERYPVNMKSCYIAPLEVPDAELDRTDVGNDCPRAKLTTQETINMLQKLRQARHDRVMQKRNRPVPAPMSLAMPVLDQSIKLNANIYLRPVKHDDASAIMEIYNHYIKESVSANEFDVRTEQHIRQRINDIVQANLPYLVAVSRKKDRQCTTPFGDNIIGFIYLDDYCDRSSMYRYTFELEFFVRPGFTRNGIAKCMLDKILGIVNSGYHPKGGYDYDDSEDYLKVGPMRVVKTILLNVPHSQDEDLQWLTKWLKSFGFRRSGHQLEVGHKHGKLVDLTTYQHHTSEKIDARVLPTVG